MKIFAVYAKVKMTDQPEWLDAFRQKYDDPYDYHITLKQPCRIAERTVTDIGQKLAAVFGEPEPSRSEIRLVFKTIAADTDLPSGACIMINCYGADRLHSLQKNIVAALAGYDNYVKAPSKQWEAEFQPHITIARHLSPARYAAAMRELPENYQCDGVVAEIVLAVVNNYNVAEAMDPENLTVYKL